MKRCLEMYFFEKDKLELREGGALWGYIIMFSDFSKQSVVVVSE